ncbi:murein hydrolase activator EnvC family protein [Paraburkholderia domus]|uniref:LysM domain-containing protein n=1 Tax=Paraburkholderia domus TaxID=2793075 RepID=A0A9N8N176_9BURK|nr:peptidoglycan DD-metalloendopeptidase family protein [Paraburkholderia domus]MBK5169405.1 peptidoglycan DD-metalloendopeptidase family protein [Burkholderia sp. R-70211]CAE6935791.1 hypothetical protein R70211_05382 [Paraburkholderia domus]
MKRLAKCRKISILLCTPIAIFSGCAFTGRENAPPPDAVETSPAPVPAGFYRFNPGDTLASVARAFGQRESDLAHMNGIEPSARIAAGQVLRVAPIPSTTAPNGATGTADKGAVTPGPLVWPLRGAVIEPFARGRKGIVLGGRPGQLVRAAAAGRVIYAGTGLSGYGPMVIIKHNASLITAYAHNSKLLVKEGESVVQGQSLAEGSVDSNGNTAIEFDVMENGYPVDPVALLGKPPE